jgi:hypothetical protein
MGVHIAMSPNKFTKIKVAITPTATKGGTGGTDTGTKKNSPGWRGQSRSTETDTRLTTDTRCITTRRRTTAAAQTAQAFTQ